MYRDSDAVIDLAEKGENTDLYAVWTGDGAVAAVAWAIDIADDDSFAYGAKPAANAIGGGSSHTYAATGGYFYG